MEKPATDIYTFEDLRKHGFTYIDKTDLILPLVDMSIGKQFFLTRPWANGLRALRWQR